MRKFCFIFFCFLATCCTAGAQSLDVFNIDASQFPVIKAKFYAFDKEGKQISSLSPLDFSLTENGQSRIITKITCPAPKPAEKVSIAMSIDISGSMSSAEGTSDIPVELGKITATNIVSVFSLPPNEIALQTCHGKAFINLDFTTNQQRILEAIKPIKADGDNDFVEHLLNPETGLLNVAKKGEHKRIAILYTDAWWYALTPDELQHCKDTCAKYNIRFYAAIYSRPEAEPNGIKRSLYELASATGGKVYDGIISKEEADFLARELKSVIDNAEACDIEWKSSPSCIIPKNVLASIPAYGIEAKGQYESPQNSLFRLEIQPSSGIALGGILPGTFIDTTLTITARQSAAEITAISASDMIITVINYGGAPPPFVLQENESRVLTIRISPVDSLRFYGRLVIENNLCTPAYAYLSGGFLGKKTAIQQLKLIHPNGNEVFSVGSDTLITWSGLPAQDSVRLDYSIDNGKSWISIASGATGLKHLWHVPDAVSDRCLIRVENNEDKDTLGKFEWAVKSFGDDALPYPYVSGARNVVDRNGNNYTCGFFTGLKTIDNISLTSYGAKDIYIGKYDPTGKIIWVRQAGSASDDKATGITLDNDGNVYICGSFSGNAVFDNGLTLSNTGSEDIFVAKYDNDGNILWAKEFGSANSESANSICIDSEDNLYIGGTHTGLDFGGGFRLVSRGGADCFVAKLHSAGDIQWATTIGGGYTEGISSIACDKNGALYLTGNTERYIGNTIYFEDDPCLIVDYPSGPNYKFLAKFNTEGKRVWVKWSASDFLAIDSLANIYTCGNFDNEINLGNGVVLKGDYPHNTNHFRAKFDSAGNAILGSVIKVKGSDYNMQLTAIASTTIGSVFVCGKLAENATFDFGNGVGFTSQSRFGSFLVNYSSTGEAQWVEDIPSSFSSIYSLALDQDESAYLAGIYSGGNFTGNIRLGEINLFGNSTFLAKYSLDNKPDQSDTSDAVFSIVKPLAASQNIDMGRVLVSSAKDSLIQSFISNTGSWPIRIDAINIAGINAADFQLVSGIPPFTISVGEKKSVEFRFRPAAVGGHAADLSVITQADTLHQTIIGEGIKPVIQVASSLIDFGVMEVGSLKDTTVTAVLKNIGDVPLAITNTQMLGPDKEQFEIISGGGNFTLASGATQTMQLRFAPKYFGRTSGQIGFDYDGMAGGRPAVVQLFGQGIGGNVYVVDDSAYIGETRDIRLMLGKVKPASVAQTAATSFRAKLAFKNSILTPAEATLLKDAVFKKGTDTDTLTVTQQWSTKTSELARIPFIATLGDRLSTEIELLEFDWLDDNGIKIDYDTELQSGVFTVLGICPEGGDRLFDANGEAQMMLVTPNPVNTSAEVRFKTIEKGITTITLTDVLGRQIELASGNYSSGEHSVEIPAGKLTQGIYFLTMQTPTQVFTQRVVVEK